MPLRGSSAFVSDAALLLCVEGDTLWLWDMAAIHPDFSVLELARSGG